MEHWPGAARHVPRAATARWQARDEHNTSVYPVAGRRRQDAFAHPAQFCKLFMQLESLLGLQDTFVCLLKQAGIRDD